MDRIREDEQLKEKLISAMMQACQGEGCTELYGYLLEQYIDEVVDNITDILYEIDGERFYDAYAHGCQMLGIVERRDSDMIFRCDTDTGKIAVHIEFQSENDKMMPCRMLRYALEIMEKHRLKPYQVVLYIGKDKAKMDNGINYTMGDNKLDYRYKIIDIGEIKFSDIAETNYFDLYSLLPIVDRKRRVEAEEKYLKMCVDLIKDAPVDIDRKRSIAFRKDRRESSPIHCRDESRNSAGKGNMC